jgi:hypothetical protein
LFVQDGEQASTAIMAHPPGGENEPDDRTAYVQDTNYVDGDDGVQPGDEAGGGPGADIWPPHAHEAAVQARLHQSACAPEGFFPLHSDRTRAGHMLLLLLLRWARLHLHAGLG